MASQRMDRSRQLLASLREVSTEIIDEMDRASAAGVQATEPAMLARDRPDTSRSDHGSLVPENLEDKVNINPYSFRQTRSQSRLQTPVFSFRQAFPQRTRRKPARTASVVKRCQSGPYLKTVILLHGPSATQVPKQEPKVLLSQNGHILNGVEFRKEWSDVEVLDHLRGIFTNKLAPTTEIEIMTSIHSTLVSPTLSPGQTLNGLVLTKVFREKPLYIRPKITVLDIEHLCTSDEEKLNENDTQLLANDVAVDGDGDYDNDDDDDILMFGSSVSSVKPFHAINCDTIQDNQQDVPQNAETAITTHCQSSIAQTGAAVIAEVTHTQTVTPTSSQVQPSTHSYASSSSTYTDYISLIDSDDDMEEEIMRVVLDRSLTETKGSHDEADLQTLLQEFKSTNMDESKECSIVVSRRRLLPSTARALKDSSFSFNKSLHVTFSGEEGEDSGGPRREYLRLLVAAICKETGMFHGPPTSLTFEHDIHKVSEKKFYTAGQIIAWSCLQGGPGLQCLSIDVYRLMTNTGPVDVERVLDSGIITDPKLLDVLRSVHSVKSESDWGSMVEKHGDFLSENGLPTIYTMKYAQKESISNMLVKELLYNRVKPEIDQFIDGMNSVGNFWNDCVMVKPTAFEGIFVDRAEPLTAKFFKSLCLLDRSEEGSNRRAEEEDTIYSWELFLLNLERNKLPVSLQDLLVFVTGANRPPPLGFPNLIRIKFYDRESGCTRYPSASTCSLHLYLPRGYDDPEEFERIMLTALQGSHGFGKI